MNFLSRLPTDLCSDICLTWISFKARILVDTACCDRIHRDHLQTILFRTKDSIHRASSTFANMQNYKKFLVWVKQRKLSVENISLTGEAVCTWFRRNIGMLCVSIKEIELCCCPRTRPNAPTIFQIIAQQCSNLEIFMCESSCLRKSIVEVINYCTRLRKFAITGINRNNKWSGCKCDDISGLRINRKANLNLKCVVVPFSADQEDYSLVCELLQRTSSLQMEHITLVGSQDLSDNILHHLCKFQNLKELDFANAVGLSDSSLIAIASVCKNILSLNVSHCTTLTDVSGVFIIQVLVNLTILNISHCRFTDVMFNAIHQRSCHSHLSVCSNTLP